MKYPLKKELVENLITRYGYPKSGAKLVACKLLHLQQPIKSMFARWWLLDEKPIVEVEGYTFGSLTESYKMTTIAVFLTLDWLIREPEPARKSLSKGNDFIYPDFQNQTGI